MSHQLCSAWLVLKKKKEISISESTHLTHQKVQIWKTIFSKIDQSFDPYFLLFKVENTEWVILGHFMKIAVSFLYVPSRI